MVGEPVQQGSGEPLRAEDLGPLVEGQIGGHQDGAPLVALGEDPEEQFRPGAGQGHEAQFVDDQQIQAGELPLYMEQPALIPGLHEFVDQAAAVKPTESPRWVEIIFLETGGDNLAASFNPELVDAAIYVIDVAGGDKVPRKGRPGVTRSDLFVINKTDLAPHVGVDLGVMERDTLAFRDGKPFVFTQLRVGRGVEPVAQWVVEAHAGLLGT